VAVLVTIAAFTVATWVAGAFVLPMHDGGVRWGIAGGLGVAVAALAALWGHSYASTEHEEPATQTAYTASPNAGRTSNRISGGTFYGPVIQGRSVSGLDLGNSAATEHLQTPSPVADNSPGEE
jgi:hypothetical protein